MTTTARELAGQSMMFRFHGPEFTDEARRAFADIRPAGVLFFSDNITSRSQIRNLCAELQREAASLELPPLLIAVDQEGGLVSRLPADFVTVPSAMAQAATGDLGDVHACARITGDELREVGINLDYAPVLDVNIDPRNPVIRTRSFGENVDYVTACGLAATDGLTDARVIPTAKHFPGHGDTNVDSHLGLPVVMHKPERLHEVELAPYKAAIAAGLPAIMSAHIVFPALDEHPATLSRKILTDLLRDQLGFAGVIFTDSMSMDAIAQRYGVGEAAVQAKAAGVDVLEANESLEDQQIRCDAITRAIDNGEFDTNELAQSAKRVQALRQQFRISYEVPELVPFDESRRRTARAVADRSVTAIGPFTPPDRGTKLTVIDFQRYRASEAEDPVNRAKVLREALGNAFPGCVVVALSHEPTQLEIADASQAAKSARSLLVVTRDADQVERQRDLAREFVGLVPEGTSTTHLAARSPYDAGLLGPVAGTLLIYGDPAVSLLAAVDVLAGAVEPAGRAPVTLLGVLHV